MRDALTEALALAVLDEECTVRIDALGPDFCAGGDLDEFGSRPDPAIAHLTRLTRSPARLMHALSERTVVRVHGACLGAGIELPAFAGTVIASPDARFGLPEVGLGLIPGAGGTVSLPRRIGRRRTAQLALSGRPISAEQALAWELVDEIRP
jgi:enoyl-CoA hydratase/carnithine racemase